jgi:PPP family 3-phenylpropionic acid transporter
MQPLIHRWGAERLFVVSMFLTGVRWLMLGMGAQAWGVLFFAQILHAATYGLFHASAIHMIHHVFPGRLQGRGQALYSGVSYGVGGALGSLLSGYTWDSLGATSTYYLAALTVSMGLVVSIYAMRGLKEHYVH